MWDDLREYWLPRVLFGGTLVLSAGLLILVALAGFLPPLPGIVLFAEDAVVRRTAIACALGLGVTALIFFRPPPRAKKFKPPRNSPPRDLAGA